METTLYRVKFSDGREFRVFCANKSQKRRMHETARNLTGCSYQVEETINGIHTINQWEQIAETINN